LASFAPRIGIIASCSRTPCWWRGEMDGCNVTWISRNILKLARQMYHILYLVLTLVPWEWYHASRTLRLMSDSQNSPMPFFAGTEGFGSTTEESAIATEDEDNTPTPSQHNPDNNTDPEIEAATMNLRRTELLALTSCVASPLIGGYLLHYIREFLSRPSEGLVSTFNITLFVMAAELRPAMKLMEMIKQRSLYLQNIVHKDTLESNVNNNNSPVVDIEPLNQKIERLENMIEELQMSIVRVQGGREEVVTGVREGVRADVEALNRILSVRNGLILGAVRRYEKSFALHRVHTEDRINLLSSRVNDLSLVVSDTNQTSHGVTNLILSIPGTGIQLVQSILALPGTLLKRVLRILLGISGGLGDKTATANKGKGVKGTKPPTKKRVSTGRSE
jgi:hypothetical protein